MAEQKLWELRYRKHPDGARSGYVSARDLGTAEKVGRAWCEGQSTGLMHAVRYISVAPAVLADETILPEAELDKLTAPVVPIAVPSLKVSSR